MRVRAVDYDAGLNESQRAVVMAGEGPILAIAGAGSGKTRTLVYRVARLVETGRPPSGIMLLTFTNKAAREMLSRVGRLLGGVDLGRLYGGTFHHVGNVILRRFGPKVGLNPDYTIIDREDSRDLLEDVAWKLREKAKRFPRGEVLLEAYSYAANTETARARALDRMGLHVGPMLGDILGVFDAYDERKRRANVVDFDDLLVLWKRLLAEHEEARDYHRSAFTDVLVDEYQDTNRVQAGIAELVAGGDGNLMVVGDDAQSIYSFRGASFGNIIDFPKRFPSCRVFKLQTNYRSTPEILALANSSIRCNNRQFAKVLRPALPQGPAPEVVRCEDERQQARFIAERVAALEEEGVNLAETAVLYRAHYHSLELQMELQAAGIPFEVRSGVRFFEQAHIKDVASYLKLSVNEKDEVAWKRILRLVPRVGPRTAGKIWEEISGASSAVRALARAKAAPKGTGPALRETADLVERARTASDPGQAILAVLEGGYRNHLALTYANAPHRVDDLKRLADFAARFDSMGSFLAQLALTGVTPQDDLARENPSEKALVLSTIHQAKGLEWTAVFVIWLVEGRFPDPRSCLEEEDLEEERRLFYVAVTRAKSRLVLSLPIVAHERGLEVLTRPSRFLEELDSSTFEEVRPTC